MKIYYITEQQNCNLSRENGVVQCENLEAAKKYADENDFKHIYLTIEDEDGNLIAYKYKAQEDDEEWTDV